MLRSSSYSAIASCFNDRTFSQNIWNVLIQRTEDVGVDERVSCECEDVRVVGGEHDERVLVAREVERALHCVRQRHCVR